MQDYGSMELKQLAQELNKLEDENFCLIIKDLDDNQLKEVMSLIGVEKKLRIMQEQSTRKNQNNSVSIKNKSPAKLELDPTANGIIPTPNLILRSSLFSASKTHGSINNSVYDFKIETYGSESKEDIQIFLTAYRQFDQQDLDLLLELIKLQQEQNSHIIKITARQIAIKSHAADNVQTYASVKEQLELLRNANIKIKYGQYEFVGGFLNSAFFDNKQKLYIIKFNEELQPLFIKNNWTGIDTNIRKQLKTNLAKWLHGFYSSHVNSKMPIKLETIYQLSGATDKDVAQWKRITVTKALRNLKEIFEANSKRFNYSIKNGFLFVNKTQSISQAKNNKNKVIVQNKNKYKNENKESCFHSQ